MTHSNRLKNRKRPARAVEIDGADPLHVRELTLAELREIDQRAEAFPEEERQLRRVELWALYSLAEPDGKPMFDPNSAEDLAEVGNLTPAELKEVGAACVPSKDDAKNG